jgi:hypothetical protein
VTFAYSYDEKAVVFPKRSKPVKKVFLLIVLLVILLLSFAACAAGPNEMQNSRNADGDVAGFWRGLWHGVIAPITFIVSLFNDNVTMYEVHNNGGWYDFGFILGVCIIFGGGGGGTGRRTCSHKAE